MESVIGSLRSNRTVGVFFVLALLAHVLLLSVPVARQAARSVAEAIPVKLQFRKPPVAQNQARFEEPAPATAMTAVSEPQTQSTAQQPKQEPAVSRNPVISAAPSETLSVPEPPQPAVTENLARRLLSDQYDSERALRKPLFSDAEELSKETRDYVMYQADSLDDVLNEPSMQLPFKDTRIYVVDYYDEGFEGRMQRFWDKVTVPFGWTTKNNTRIQCAWVLVFAGCGWGDKRLFHQEAKKRKPESSDEA